MTTGDSFVGRIAILMLPPKVPNGAIISSGGQGLEMEIAFSTQSLRSICENEAVMIQKLGGTAAQAFQVCLSDLRAASRIADVTANYAAEFVSGSDIELAPTEGLRVRLRANVSKLKKSKTKPIDWATVSRLKIMEVVHRG